ncbi:insecticidal delta-endotoxin Cry8Ea1 family protein, partial [Bacillus thuringiensis]
MSPNNQNEYEIIDATPSTSVTNDSTRYPFANDPTNTLQNMNYKDYLRMSDSYSPEYLTSPVPFSQFGTVDQIISIIGLLNSAAGIPGLDFVTGLLQFILDFFAPEDPWAELMEIVEQLIDQKITESTRDKAFAELRGLLNGYLVYQQSLESWLENPNAARSSIVREQFVALELDFVTSIPSFAITGQEIPLLAVFAQAANLHLLLMRDASVFGERWGLKESEVNTYYNRQMTYTEQYSDYCVKIYNTGLNQLKGTSSSDWIEYNRFRREMTLLVLDAVAIFPSYDMRRYPVATKTEFTRIVYTDPLGFDMKKGVVTNGWTSVGPSFSSIELLTGSPDLFKWLEKLEIFSKRISEPSVFINSWAGHTISQFLTGTSSTTSTTTHGNTANPVQRFVVDTRKQGYIYQTIAYPHAVNTNVFFLFGVPKVIFGLIGVGISGPTAPNLTFSDSTGGNLESIERDSTSELPPIESSSDTPQPIQDTYSHRLDSAAMITTNKSYGSGYIPLLGWTHRSVDRNNTIYPDKITQIPIVKAQELGHVPIPGPPISEVVPGPGFTGGDILHVQANGQFISKMTVNVQNINKEYIMRIRYASITDRVFYLNATGTPVYSSAQKTMNSGEPLTYDKFNYATSSPIKFSSTNLTIALGSSSNIYGSAIETYIDRIEFIPVDETYEAEQDLENAKKAVNALFTNTKDG